MPFGATSDLPGLPAPFAGGGVSKEAPYSGGPGFLAYPAVPEGASHRIVVSAESDGANNGEAATQCNGDDGARGYLAYPAVPPRPAVLPQAAAESDDTDNGGADTQHNGDNDTRGFLAYPASAPETPADVDTGVASHTGALLRAESPEGPIVGIPDAKRGSDRPEAEAPTTTEGSSDGAVEPAADSAPGAQRSPETETTGDSKHRERGDSDSEPPEAEQVDITDETTGDTGGPEREAGADEPPEGPPPEDKASGAPEDEGGNPTDAIVGFINTSIRSSTEKIDVVTGEGAGTFGEIRTALQSLGERASALSSGQGDISAAMTDLVRDIRNLSGVEDAETAGLVSEIGDLTGIDIATEGTPAGAQQPETPFDRVFNRLAAATDAESALAERMQDPRFSEGGPNTDHAVTSWASAVQRTDMATEQLTEAEERLQAAADTNDPLEIELAISDALTKVGQAAGNVRRAVDDASRARTNARAVARTLGPPSPELRNTPVVPEPEWPATGSGQDAGE